MPKISTSNEILGYLGLSPMPRNSHHQDYLFLVGDPYQPSFATVTGRGATQRIPMEHHETWRSEVDFYTWPALKPRKHTHKAILKLITPSFVGVGWGLSFFTWNLRNKNKNASVICRFFSVFGYVSHKGDEITLYAVDSTNCHVWCLELVGLHSESPRDLLSIPAKMPGDSEQSMRKNSTPTSKEQLETIVTSTTRCI